MNNATKKRFFAYIDDMGQATLAKALGVTRGAVHNWRHQYSWPSAKMTKRLEHVSDGYLTRAELRPDIYGDLEDIS